MVDFLLALVHVLSRSCFYDGVKHRRLVVLGVRRCTKPVSVSASSVWDWVSPLLIGWCSTWRRSKHLNLQGKRRNNAALLWVLVLLLVQISKMSSFSSIFQTSIKYSVFRNNEAKSSEFFPKTREIICQWGKLNSFISKPTQLSLPHYDLLFLKIKQKHF